MTWLNRKRLHCFGCGLQQPYNNSITKQNVNGLPALCWTCHKCDYHNICAQDTAQPLDNIPPHNQQSTSFTKPAIIKSRQQYFCNTCIHNQQLQVTLLAAHIPADDAPDFAERYASAEAFKRSLEKQYPSVCANCAPIVAAELERQKQDARKQALNLMIRRSGQESQEFPIRVRHRKFRQNLPIIRLTITIIFIAFCLMAVFEHQSVQILHTPAITTLLASFIFLPFNVAAEHSRRVIGSQTYVLLEVLLFTWRLLVIFGMKQLTSTSQWYMPLAGAGIAISIIMSCSAYMSLKEVKPRKINLVGSKVELESLSERSSPSPILESLKPKRPLNLCPPLHATRTLPTSPPLTPPQDVIKTANYDNVNLELMDWAPVVSNSSFPSKNASPFARVATDPSILTNSSGNLSFGFSTRKPNHFKDRPHYLLPKRQNQEPELGPQTFFGSEKATGLEDLFSQTLAIKDDNGLVEQMRQFGKLLYGAHNTLSRWMTFLAAISFTLSMSVNAADIQNSRIDAAINILPYVLSAAAYYSLGKYRADLVSFVGFRQPGSTTEEFQEQFSAKSFQIMLTKRLQQLLVARVVLYLLQMNLHKSSDMAIMLPWLQDYTLSKGDVSAMPGFILDSFTLLTILTQWKRPVQPL